MLISSNCLFDSSTTILCSPNNKVENSQLKLRIYAFASSRTTSPRCKLTAGSDIRRGESSVKTIWQLGRALFARALCGYLSRARARTSRAFGAFALASAMVLSLGAANAQSPPTFTKSFGSTSFLVSTTTGLTFTITNPNATPLTGIGFNDPLPSGLTVATGAVAGSACGGTVTAVAGGNSISLSSGSLAANSQCIFGLDVLGSTTGVKTNTTSVITSNEGGNGAAATASVTVTTIPTGVETSSSVNPSHFGQPVTFGFTVSSTIGTGTPTGTVTLSDGGATPIGSATLTPGPGAGQAQGTLTTSALPVGNLTITVTYGGDANFSSHSGSFPFTVLIGVTNTRVTSSQNPSTSGQPVTFTATVSPVAPATGTPSGTVTFLDGGNSIGTGTLSGGIATITTSALAVGAHTITTSYSGDPGFSSGTGSLTGNPQVVNQAAGTATTTTVTSSQNPSAFGQSVTFTAKVSPATGTGTPTGTITFLDGGNAIGTSTLSGGMATLTTSTLAVGNHTITTDYSGRYYFCYQHRIAHRQSSGRQ
jgi:large repetitive protein